MIRKSFVLMIVVVALLTIGALFVAAQDDQPTAPQCGYGMMADMPGMGMMMGHGRGMMLGMDDMPGMTAVAEALGMESDALIEALHSGQTLAQIAEDQGVDVQAVTDAMFAAAETHLAELVAAGTLTQAQADDHLATMHDHLADMPMVSGTGCSLMGGMQGMDGMGGMMEYGRGMMGRGHGMGMGRHS